MTVVDKTPPSQNDAIAFEVDLRHKPEKVWRAITEPALLAEWLLPVVNQKLALEKGAAFVLQTQPFPGWDGTVNCRMLEIDAPRKLSYAWVVGDMELDTVVTFTLTPSEAGTRMSIVQSGFKPHQKQNWGGARYGWKMMSEKLEALLEKAE
jgi:uncharacterized protein YndB with AHSA1/START domain